ncbi:MAG: trigger factor [Clostridia bacterium]
MSLKSCEKTETNVYQVEVQVDAETFESAVNKAYLKNKKRINVPGFRKGKAPRAIIEKMYGAAVFYEDAIDIVYPEAVEEAMKEAGHTLVAPPADVEIVSVGKEGVEFKFKATVKPEVEIGTYKGLKAYKEEIKVEASEVDARIEELRDRNSRMVTVEDREAKDGDMVEIDFEGFTGGEAFEGGKAENYNLTLGSGSFIPGFEDQIVGHKTGDEFEINVKFPEDYAPELAGKDATFKIKLHEIKEKQLPEVDDEFVKDVSEFETLDELKKDIEENLRKEKEHQADHEVDDQIMEELISGLKAEIPEVMYENRVNESVRNFESRLNSQGMALEAYLQYTGMDMDKFREGFRAQAEMQVKGRLALEKVAELEGLVPTDEDIEAEYKRYADTYNMDIETVKKVIPAEDIKDDLCITKAVDFIKDNADVKTGKKPAKKDDAEEKKPAAKKTAAKKTTAKKAAKKDEEK